MPTNDSKGVFPSVTHGAFAITQPASNRSTIEPLVLSCCEDEADIADSTGGELDAFVGLGEEIDIGG